VAPFILKKPKKDPLKKQMEYFCKCYARGEISQEDFNELKKDLYNYKLNSTEGTIKKKQMHKHIN
jgi:hypothetical protein